VLTVFRCGQVREEGAAFGPHPHLPSPSGVEGSSVGEKKGGYGVDDLGEMAFHVVGEPHDAIAAGFEECLSLDVSGLLTEVNQAVNLHDEAMAGAEEIDHEGANGLLTSEGDTKLIATLGSVRTFTASDC